jgi:sugar lactone lactonase YvrE
MRNEITLFLILFVCSFTKAQQVTTIAGNYGGYIDGTGIAALFSNPYGICIDSNTGDIYIADAGNNRIRKMTSTGVVTTLAGSTRGYADGQGTNAKFDYPETICMGTDGFLYVADFYNQKIRKISLTGTVTTAAGSSGGFADGPAATAQFNSLEFLCPDPQGNIYIADGGNNRIRKLSPDGQVTTFAGAAGGGYQNGPVATAKFNYPTGICRDAAGNFYITEAFGAQVRKISNTGIVSLIAGGIVPGDTVGFADGQGTAAKFNYPMGICIDPQENLYVADGSNHRIRKINPTGFVSTWAGGNTFGYIDAIGTAAMFSSPSDVCFDLNGNLIVAEIGNDKIRKIIDLLSTENFEQNIIKLYSNPNNGNFHINGLENYSIEIYDILGQLVFTKNEIENEIETGLKRGIYLVKITSEDGKIGTKKMVVE